MRHAQKRVEFGEGIDLGSLDISVKVEDDSEWKDNWKEYFKPVKVGKTIVVKPTWEEYKPASGEKVIEIDPGMAFGTGTHETTSLCIRLMEEYVKPGNEGFGCGMRLGNFVGCSGTSGCIRGSRC